MAVVLRNQNLREEFASLLKAEDAARKEENVFVQVRLQPSSHFSISEGEKSRKVQDVSFRGTNPCVRSSWSVLMS